MGLAGHGDLGVDRRDIHDSARRSRAVAAQEPADSQPRAGDVDPQMTLEPPPTGVSTMSLRVRTPAQFTSPARGSGTLEHPLPGRLVGHVESDRAAGGGHVGGDGVPAGGRQHPAGLGADPRGTSGHQHAPDHHGTVPVAGHERRRRRVPADRRRQAVPLRRDVTSVRNGRPSALMPIP